METLDLKPPHGFLVWRGKQTAIAGVSPLEAEDKLLVTSDGEAFGMAKLDKAVTLNTSEFEREEWVAQHCIRPNERRLYWADEKVFYVHRVTDFEPFEKPKIYLDGNVIDEPELSESQRTMIWKSKLLPKHIPLIQDAVLISDSGEVSIVEGVNNTEYLHAMLSATYETDIKTVEKIESAAIPLYSLALVRNPRLRVIAEIKKNEMSEKQEGDSMPWEIRARGDEFCVVKIGDNEVEGCHNTRNEAEDQLAALNIAEAEPKKKEGLVSKLKSAYEALGNFLAAPDGKVFQTDTGISIKTVNGEPWHFTWSTNAFEDRDREIFSTKGLEQYVLENETRENKGFFNFWHINKEDGNFNTDFARKEWQGVIGRFLVEAGPYLNDHKGQSAMKFFSEFKDGHPTIAPEGWGCSPEFKFLPEERMTGVFENIWIIRTSTLPRMAAANIWTEAKQEGVNMALTDSQKEAAIAAFGEEFVSNVLAEGDQKTQDLEAAGIAHKGEEENKSVDETEENPVSDAKESVPELEIDMEVLAKAVAEQFEINNKPIVEAMEIFAEGIKALGDKVAKLEKTKELQLATENPRWIMSLKRASEAEETQVSETDNLKEKKPEEVKPALNSSSYADSFFGHKK